MSIMAIDFSAGDFRNYNESDFLVLSPIQLGPTEFTLDFIPKNLENATCLLCIIPDGPKNFCGTFLFDKVKDNPDEMKHNFIKRNQNLYCLLKVTKDGKNVFPPYGIGSKPGTPPSSNVWNVSLTPPLIYDDSLMGDTVTITALDTNTTDTFRCVNAGQSTEYVSYVRNN